MADFKYLFGPVLSRRLGISLGVDLIPHKTCPLDCIYCEAGKTTNHTLKREVFYPVSEIISELKAYLFSFPKLDYITFSGSGEPLLYSGIGSVIKWIKENYSDYKIALITNSILLKDESVIEEIMDVDLIVPSLDAADQETFKKINRPVEGLNIEDVLNGMELFFSKYKGQTWMEIFIAEGINDSIYSLTEIKKWIIKFPHEKIQINSLDRPGTDKMLKKASMDTLFKVKEFFGEKAEIVVRREKRENLNVLDDNAEKSILKNIKIRSMTLNDLSSVTGIEEKELDKILSILESEKKITAGLIDNIIFYSIV